MNLAGLRTGRSASVDPRWARTEAGIDGRTGGASRTGEQNEPVGQGRAAEGRAAEGRSDRQVPGHHILVQLGNVATGNPSPLVQHHETLAHPPGEGQLLGCWPDSRQGER